MADNNNQDLAAELKKALRKESLLRDAKQSDIEKVSEEISEQIRQGAEELTQDMFADTDPTENEQIDRSETETTRETAPETDAAAPGAAERTRPAIDSEKPSFPEQSIDRARNAAATPEETEPSTETSRPDQQPEQYRPFEQGPELIESEPTERRSDQNEQPEPQTAEEEMTDQKENAARLRADRRKSDLTRQRKGDGMDAEEFARKHNVDLEGNVSGDPRAAAAGKVGEVFGKELSRRIATGSFRAFAIALTLALIKDGGDLVGLADAGTFTYMILGSVDLMITAALSFIIASQTGWLKMKIQKVFIRKFVGSIVIELLPFGEFIPLYTVMILLLKRDADRDRKKHQKAQGDLQQQMKKISRRSIPKGRQLQRVTAAMGG